jgi:hypothetical protein
MPIQDKEEGANLYKQENDNKHHWYEKGVIVLIGKSQYHPVEKLAFK